MLNIINYYEILVTDHLWKITTDPDNTLSQSAIEDVACLALNKLPAAYVRNPIDKGANLSDLDYQEMHQAVVAAISEALQQVLNHPHDNREI